MGAVPVFDNPVNPCNLWSGKMKEVLREFKVI
jgi:hypothetical protein